MTTLTAEGEGSLRAALDDPRPRLVVFEAGGVIDLHGRPLIVRHPHLLVAGQTAPDPGITMIRGALIVETSDVTIQHIAVRSGSAYADDAMGARRGPQPVHDVVFDHCSATWAVDENLSVSGPADMTAETSHDVTLRSCLIAEGLSHSVHAKGEHSKGTLIHDGVRNVTISGCLYAHNRQRNPRLKGSTTAALTENVIYDWGDQCVGVGARGNRKVLAPAEATLVGNVAIAGPSTTSPALVKNVDDGGGKLTLRDNVLVASGARPREALAPRSGERVALSVAKGRVRGATRATLERVLRTAGARPAHRDAIDTRIVQSVIDGTGRIIDSQEEVGGYPVRPATRRALVVPKSGREAWLQRLSDELSTDRAIDLAPLWKRLSAAPSPDSRR